jgi:hypothetical protein
VLASYSAIKTPKLYASSFSIKIRLDGLLPVICLSNVRSDCACVPKANAAACASAFATSSVSSRLSGSGLKIIKSIGISVVPWCSA